MCPPWPDLPCSSPASPCSSISPPTCSMDTSIRGFGCDDRGRAVTLDALAHRLGAHPEAIATAAAVALAAYLLQKSSAVRALPALGRAAVWTVAWFALVAAAAPVVAPPPAFRDPYQIPTTSFAIEPQPPDAAHPLGTTENQFDLYYGIVWVRVPRSRSRSASWWSRWPSAWFWAASRAITAAPWTRLSCGSPTSFSRFPASC